MGAINMMNHQVTFDRAAQRIGFCRTDCLAMRARTLRSPSGLPSGIGGRWFSSNASDEVVPIGGSGSAGPSLRARHMRGGLVEQCDAPPLPRRAWDWSSWGLPIRYVLSASASAHLVMSAGAGFLLGAVCLHMCARLRRARPSHCAALGSRSRLQRANCFRHDRMGLVGDDVAVGRISWESRAVAEQDEDDEDASSDHCLLFDAEGASVGCGIKADVDRRDVVLGSL